MNEPTPQRPRFTLMQLFVAVTVISVLLGVGAPLIRGCGPIYLERLTSPNETLTPLEFVPAAR